MVNTNGGLAASSKELLPLDGVIYERMIGPMREYFRSVMMEKNAHIETLQLLQAVKKGEISLDRLIVTDDGWQVTPERPQSQDPIAEVPTDGRVIDFDSLPTAK